jgi:hypothetical protein
VALNYDTLVLKCLLAFQKLIFKLLSEMAIYSRRRDKA